MSLGCSSAWIQKLTVDVAHQHLDQLCKKKKKKVGWEKADGDHFKKSKWFLSNMFIHVLLCSGRITAQSAAAILDRHQEKHFCGGNKMFSDVGLTWHETFEVYELVSKPLIWKIFPETVSWNKSSINKTFVPRSSHLTGSSTTLWNILILPKNTASTQSVLLTRPDADPSQKPFDHFNARSDDGLDSLACCLICLLGSLFHERVVWSPAVKSPCFLLVLLLCLIRLIHCFLVGFILQSRT